MFEKRATTATPIHDLLARRWSGRTYDPDRSVSREHLLSLMEAARWAPSCFGDEPWRYLVWDRTATPEAWSRAFDCLSDGNKEWVRHAPVLMLSAANSRFTKKDAPNRWGQHDTGAASMSLCVQATALGLMVHQMGGFDAERVRAAFTIPEQFTPMAMIAVGYQLPEDRIPPALREREYAPRARRPLEETFFAAEWGKPFGAR